MKKEMKTNHWLGIIITGIMLGASIQFAMAWTEPSSKPPKGNLAAPLNVGNKFQEKAGGLFINRDNVSGFGLMNRNYLINYGSIIAMHGGNVIASKDVRASGDVIADDQVYAGSGKYNLILGTVNSVSDYRKVDNIGGPWIYAFNSSPDAHSLNGSIGIRVRPLGSQAGLVVGKGKGRWADVWARTFHYTSDKRLKKDIKTINNALEKITKIRGVEYKMKDGNVPGMGVIAQEIESQFPALVSTGPSGYKTVEYNGFIGVFIEAFKEQQKQIKEQQKEIDELKQALQELKNRQ